MRGSRCAGLAPWRFGRRLGALSLAGWVPLARVDLARAGAGRGGSQCPAS